MERRFLFLFGVARSGTTALTQVVNANPRIAIGMERYLKLGKRGALTPEHFTVEAFFDERTPTRRLNTSPAFRAKFERAEVVGDKIPRLDTGLAKIVATFPAPYFVGIVRDPFEVAHSWYRRANAEERRAWAPWMSDTTSVAAQAGFWRTVLATAPADRMLLVSYRTMLRDGDAMAALARRVARLVGVDEAFDAAEIGKLGRKAARLQPRERPLDPAASAFVEANYFWPLLEALDAAGTATVAELPAALRDDAVRFYAARPAIELEALDSLVARGLGGGMIQSRRAKLVVGVASPERAETMLLDALDADPANAVALRQLGHLARRRTGEGRRAHALVALARKRLDEGAPAVAARLLDHAGVDAAAPPRLRTAAEALRREIDAAAGPTQGGGPDGGAKGDATSPMDGPPGG